MPTYRPPLLTVKGQRVARLYRDATYLATGVPRELNMHQLLDEIFCGAPGAAGECCVCGEWRRLIGGYVCLGCTAGCIAG